MTSCRAEEPGSAAARLSSCPESGVRVASQIQIDKIMTVPRAKLGRPIGAVDESAMRGVDEALARFLGLG